MFTRRALFGGILGALGLTVLRACVTGPVPQASTFETLRTDYFGGRSAARFLRYQVGVDLSGVVADDADAVSVWGPVEQSDDGEHWYEAPALDV